MLGFSCILSILYIDIHVHIHKFMHNLHVFFFPFPFHVYGIYGTSAVPSKFGLTVLGL